MKIPVGALTAVLIANFLFLACSGNYEEIKVLYREESTGDQVEALYRNYSGGEASTVTLRWSDGSSRTLTQGPAASGVRYTDETTLTWWTKGEGAFREEFRNGDWEITGTYLELPAD